MGKRISDCLFEVSEELLDALEDCATHTPCYDFPVSLGTKDKIVNDNFILNLDIEDDELPFN